MINMNILKNIVLEYYSSTDFPVLVLVCSVLAPALCPTDGLIPRIGWDDFFWQFFSLQWRRNETDGVSNYQSHDCLLNRLFRRRSKKTSKLRVTGLYERNSPMTGEFPHKGPVTRKMFPFDDVIMWWFTLIPFASWFLLPALPLNYALSCSENGLVPQERIKTLFSQNKPIFKQKMSLKMVSAKYRPFVGTGAIYTISLEICTRIGCAFFVVVKI